MEEMNFAAIAFVGSVRVTNCYFEPEVSFWETSAFTPRAINDNVLYHSPPGLASQQHVLGAFVRDAALSCK
jgi:hypothetical protein